MNETKRTYEIMEPWTKRLYLRALNFLKESQIQKEPQTYIIALSISFTLFILSGGMFVITEGSEVVGGVFKIAFFFNYNNEILVNPLDPASKDKHFLNADTLIMDNHGQYLIEGLLVLIILLTGSVGLFLIRYSTRYAYDVRLSTSRLILGWVLVAIAIGGMMFLLGEKSFKFSV